MKDSLYVGLGAERFRAACLGLIEQLKNEPSTDPGIGKRVHAWAENAPLIDEEDDGRALRQLVAMAGLLADQNAVNTQRAIWDSVRPLRIPLWISAGALVWMAFQI